MLSLFAKELRQQTSLSLVVFALGLMAVAYAFAQGVLAADGRWPLWLGGQSGDTPLYLWLVAAALLLTAPAYAAERQQGTEVILHTLPETRYVLWVTKGGAALLLLALAAGLPMLLAAALLVRQQDVVLWLGSVAAGALITACLGLFASSLAHSTYGAVLYGVFGAVLYFTLGAGLAYWLPGDASGTELLLGLVCMVAPACLVGSCRVMTAAPTESRWPGLVTAGLWLGLTGLGAVVLGLLVTM